MLETKTPTRIALVLLAIVCLTPAGPAGAAPGEPLGEEFQVNTTIANDQEDPAIAMDPDGDFVVAWHSCPVDADGWPIRDGCDVFAQLFDAAGVPQGGELLVNTAIAQVQYLPDVAMDDHGAFVVVWWGFDWGGSPGIFARRYSAEGVPQGAEVQVAATDSTVAAPSVAMDAEGNFVVVWSSGSLLRGQRYNAVGEPQGGIFGLWSTNQDPVVAMDAAGNFVVAWEYHGRIVGLRFDDSGVAQGNRFFISSTESHSEGPPAIAMNAGGEFVVVWEVLDFFGQGPGAFGQLYGAAGDPMGSRFQLGAGRPDVAMAGGGDFVVTWTGFGTAGVWGIHGQRFDAGGLPQEGEFQANLYPTTTLARPPVAMDADGDLVVTWLNWDGDSYGIFAQRFDGAERGDGDFDGDGKPDILWRNTVTGNTVVWLMDGATRLAEGSIGRVPTAWQIAGTGDFNGDGKADILWHHSGTGNAIVWQMNGFERTAAQSIGTVPLAWSVEGLRDTNGDGLSDIVWRNTATDTAVVWRMAGFTRVTAEEIDTHRVPADWDLY